MSSMVVAGLAGVPDEVDEAEGRLGEVRGGGRVAPALRVHLDSGRLWGHALQCDT